MNKKQIEEEGWKYKREVMSGCLLFEKGNYWLGFYEVPKFIKIVAIDPCKVRNIDLMDTYKLYQGECHYIKDLRYICKLLNI